MFGEGEDEEGRGGNQQCALIPGPSNTVYEVLDDLDD